MVTSGRWTVGSYLVERLREVGVKHVFGVAGDYVLGLMDEIVESQLELVGTCNELNAGYAADAYARLAGVGAVCVTYAVGGFSVLNAIAGAYAERVPVIAICGGPSRADRQAHRQLHHTLGNFDVQVDVFRQVTQTSIGLQSAELAPDRIDEAVRSCLRYRRPVFIEVPTDLVSEPCSAPEPLQLYGPPPSDPDVLAEAVAEASQMLSRAERPVVLGGVEIHRFGLQAELEAFLEHAHYPLATGLMGKSVVRETLPQYIGMYYGAPSEDYVRETVETADCVLGLGAWMSDVDLGIYTARLDTARLIHASADRVAIKHHFFERVFLGDFINGLREALPAASADEATRRIRPAVRSLAEKFEARSAEPITVARFYQRVNHFLGDTHIVLADAGDCFFAAGDMVMHEDVSYIAQAFYASIGFTIPGALGVGLAHRDKRPVVFVGDGAFQMTGQEVSTLIRQGLAPILFLMNNRGYTVERLIHEGPYNDIQNWQYHRFPEVFGGGWGAEVRTEGDLERALERAKAEPERLALIEVHLDPLDSSAALKRLGQAMKAERALS